MNTIWFPTPIVVLLRRVANVVSGLSISHQYLHNRSQLDSDRDTEKTSWLASQWISWSNGSRRLSQSAPNRAVEEQAFSSSTSPPAKDARRCESYDPDDIHRLIHSPVLYDPVRTPRYPIALCHGLYGFDVRGPSAFPILQMHYWTNVLNILRRTVGAEVIVTSVPSTGSIASRAESMDRFLRQKAAGRGINFMAHSMGGLDCRHLITHLKPSEYTPLSLTSIATPHRGSPFMDWCKENLGLGRLRKKDEALLAAEAHQDLASVSALQQPKIEDNASESSGPSRLPLALAALPSSFTTLLLSILDSPAYANLTSTYLNTIFNPQTPDDPRVKYFSVAGRVSSLSIWHPLWLPKMVIDGFEEHERDRFRKDGDPRHHQDDQWGNDALVTVQSARWGQFLGIIEGCDHWDLRGARGLDVDLPSVSIPGLNLGIGSSSKGDRESETEDSSSSSYGWGLGDWTRFVRAWKREERDAAKKAGAGISERDSRESKEEKHQRARQEADDAVKSSTDKMSAVFDWIAEQVPSRAFDILPSTSSEGKGPSEVSPEHACKPEPERTKKAAERSELATKKDLERFYVALCRKLYDEGL